MRPLHLLSFALAFTSPLAAQYVQPLPVLGDADALADQVRALAANPQDLSALIRAGELTLKLDDATAAAGFFARAERIDPRNARVKAGLGVLLVQAERPGEALRRFAEAESYGGRVATFAADRGLAYDLIGEQERAQRDYRLALKTSADDETTRRYALSLGISGKRDEALALLDPLLRKSDHGAWRARAFVLAMSGDKAGAEKIATTMMPAGLSQGLQPFFDRLAALSPVDRAFAVHFGEIRASPARLADARLAPPLPPLGADPDARELAALAKTREKPERKEDEEKPAKRKRGRHQPVELAIQAAAPPIPPALPGPPAYVDPSTVVIRNTASATGGYYVQPLPAPRPFAPSSSAVAQANRAAAVAMPEVSAPVAQTRFVTAAQPSVVAPSQPLQRMGGRVMPLAPLQPEPLPAAIAPPVRATPPPAEVARKVGATPQPSALPTYQPAQRVSGRIMPPPASVQPAPLPAAVATVRATPPAEVAIKVEPAPQVRPGMPYQAAQRGPEPMSPASLRPAAPPITTAPTKPAPPPEPATKVEAVPQVAATPQAAPTPAPVAVASTPPVAPLPVPVPETAVAPANSLKAHSEDTILASIIAKIGVPGAELGIAPVEKPAPVVEPEAPRPAPVEIVQVEERHKKVEPPVEKIDTRKKAGADTKADASAQSTTDAKKVADTKKLADTRKADAKKAADLKKATDAKKLADARKKDPKVLEPSRVWVQVSGGANENDLPKQWSKLRRDQPSVFKSRQGWSTPLRATNRILTGPFASEAEAQAFVNSLAKKGLSGFLFTSDAGQKIDKLPAK